MRRILVGVFLAASAVAQNPAPPAFEVASVKMNQYFRQDDRSTWVPFRLELSPGSLTMRNYSLRMATAWAYHVQYSQIAGPDWIDAIRYDIIAKTGAGAQKDDELRPMLKALLAERFHMAVHRENREMEVLALLLPKGGQHKMKESDPNVTSGAHDDPARGRVIQGVGLQVLLDEWSRELTVPMVDMTGLTGRFDFSLNTKKYVEALRSRVMADPTSVPTDDLARVILFQDLVAGELGLRLEPRKAPVGVIVIDRADRSPVEN